MRGLNELRLHIGNIEISKEEDVLVIPEIGINHGGSLAVAKKMIDAASEAGARLVKHQTHIVDDEMSEAAHHIKPGNSDKSIFSIMQKCALNEEDEYEMMRYANEKGLEFLSTPFSRKAADRLEKMGVKAYKIGSGEMNNLPLVEHVAEFGKPMIISTGMNSIRTIADTVNCLEKKSISFALLHTTNLYPTEPEYVRLGAMQEMMREFKGIPIGLSDHTIDNLACIAAISMGAVIVERHFTDTKKRVGPDIICSMDKMELEKLIEASKKIKKMMGGKKVPLKEEQVTIDFAFASVVAIDDIKEGEIFTEKNIWVKRPGTGEIPAKDYKKILGKVATTFIRKDTLVNKQMVKGI